MVRTCLQLAKPKQGHDEAIPEFSFLANFLSVFLREFPVFGDISDDRDTAPEVALRPLEGIDP